MERKIAAITARDIIDNSQNTLTPCNSHIKLAYKLKPFSSK